MRKRTVLPMNYVVKDEQGNFVSVPHKVARPITDPAWNARQAGKRERMSKKERLAQRRRIEEMVQRRKAEG